VTAGGALQPSLTFFPDDGQVREAAAKRTIAFLPGQRGEFRRQVLRLLGQQQPGQVALKELQGNRFDAKFLGCNGELIAVIGRIAQGETVVCFFLDFF